VSLAANQQSANRAVDRVSTIILLVVGAYSALSVAIGLFRLHFSLMQAATILKIEDFEVPQSAQTLGQVGAICILALYAVTLIFSIQRLRARKLTFWVPLAAGAVAMVLWIIFTLVAFSQSPAIMQALAQPDAMQQMLDYLQSQAQTPAQ